MITQEHKKIAQEYLADKELKGVWVNSKGELFLKEAHAMTSDKDAEFVKKGAKEKGVVAPKIEPLKTV
jgi:hypothetical protein